MALPSGLCLTHHPMAKHQSMCRRLALVGIAGGVLSLNRLSLAGAARPILLSELVQNSPVVTVGVARSSTSRWVEAYGGRRILTYTRVEVLQSMGAKDPADADLYVETLGGSVGDIAQVVHGEPQLVHGEPCVAFLRKNAEGLYRLTARAQGHYPLKNDNDGAQRLSASPKLADLTTRLAHGAVSRLKGRTLAVCERLVKQEISSAP